MGTAMRDGSYSGFPAAQYSAVSATVPFGARSTGGFIFEPTGSDASVAAAHCSNHPAGIRSPAFSGATPVSQRVFADVIDTLRYAPKGPLCAVSATFPAARSHWGAERPNLF